MTAKRSKSERVHLPMLNVVMENELGGGSNWPEKYIVPKHLMLKGSKRREFISQTNIKPYRKALKTEEPTLLQPLHQLEQLSRFFEKNYERRKPRKIRFPEQEQIVNRHHEAIRLAHSRTISNRYMNPEKEKELLDEFNRELHLRRWGELGLIIKSQKEKQLARSSLLRSSYLKTDS